MHFWVNLIWFYYCIYWHGLHRFYWKKYFSTEDSKPINLWGCSISILYFDKRIRSFALLHIGKDSSIVKLNSATETNCVNKSKQIIPWVMKQHFYKGSWIIKFVVRKIQVTYWNLHTISIFTPARPYVCLSHFSVSIHWEFQGLISALPQLGCPPKCPTKW